MNPMKVVRFINLTPHEIVLVRADGTSVKVPPSGRVARVESNSEVIGEADGVPTVGLTFGRVQGFPSFLEEEEGTLYLVSALVLTALRRSGDEFERGAPAAAPTDLVRDDQGRVVGAKALSIR